MRDALQRVTVHESNNEQVTFRRVIKRVAPKRGAKNESCTEQESRVAINESSTE